MFRNIKLFGTIAGCLMMLVITALVASTLFSSATMPSAAGQVVGSPIPVTEVPTVTTTTTTTPVVTATATVEVTETPLPEETAQPTIIVDELPNTGSGSTAREVKSSNHVTQSHYIGSVCWNGWYQSIYGNVAFVDQYGRHYYYNTWMYNHWYRCV